MTALLTIILSFIGALVCGLMPSSAHRRIRWVALAVAAAGLAVSMVCCLNYSGGDFADLVKADWIPSLGIGDRKSTRLNSSHVVISYAVFCLKKKIEIAHV